MAQAMLILLIAAVAALPAAYANDQYAEEKHPDIDLASFTCDDFLRGIQSGHAEKMHALVMWLEGYMGGISGNTLVNWHDLREFKHDLIAHCQKNGSHGLLEAARRAGIY